MTRPVRLDAEDRPSALDHPVADADVLRRRRRSRRSGRGRGRRRGRRGASSRGRRPDPAAGRSRTGRRSGARSASGSPSRRCRPARRAGRGSPSMAKVDLGDAEAAEGAGRRVVRVDGARLDVDVRDAVGAAGVAGGPLEDLRADAGVGARCRRRSGPARRRGGPRRRSRPRSPWSARGASGGAGGSRARDRARRTGRPVTRASSAAWPWTVRSSLPPNAPPVATWVTRTVVSGRPRSEATWRRSSQAPWPCEKRWSDGGAPGRRRPAPPGRPPARGRRARSRCVVNARGRRGRRWPAPPRRRRAGRPTSRGGCRPAWTRGASRLEGRERVGDRLEHLVLDLDQRGGRAGLAARAGGHGRQHVADVAGRLALGDEDRPVAGDEALDRARPGRRPR